MKDELNRSYNGGVVVYLLQSVAIHFYLTVYIVHLTDVASVIDGTSGLIL